MKLNQTITLKRNARIAGILYFLQIPLGIFGIIYIQKFILVNNDIHISINNFIEHESIARWSILSSIVCALVTIATAYYLHKTLEFINRKLSLTMLFFIILVAPISIINEINYLSIFSLIENFAELELAQKQEILNEVKSLIILHHQTMQMINLFFGLWLLPMGLLVAKSKLIPSFIGYFLLITCSGYLIDWCCFILHIQLPIVISEYTWIGEVMMVFWLLIKGVRIDINETTLTN